MLKEYRQRRAWAKKLASKNQAILELRQQKIEQNLFRRQLSCEHEFSDPTAYPRPYGMNHITGHFVACRKCSLRREV